MSDEIDVLKTKLKQKGKRALQWAKESEGLKIAGAVALGTVAVVGTAMYALANTEQDERKRQPAPQYNLSRLAGEHGLETKYDMFGSPTSPWSSPFEHPTGPGNTRAWTNQDSSAASETFEPAAESSNYRTTQREGAADDMFEPAAKTSNYRTTPREGAADDMFEPAAKTSNYRTSAQRDDIATETSSKHEYAQTPRSVPTAREVPEVNNTSTYASATATTSNEGDSSGRYRDSYGCWRMVDTDEVRIRDGFKFGDPRRTEDMRAAMIALGLY